MAHNHNPEEFDDTPLGDISDLQLDQLTELLWMDQGVNIVMPDQEWLQSQYDGIAQLDKSSRRSKSIWKRLSSGLENLTLTPRHVNDGRSTACLCEFHRDFDPKLIRRLMDLIMLECTVRIHRYREWRRRNNLPVPVTQWLNRIDAMTGLWMSRDAFNAAFGYERVSPNQNKVRSKCEACIMAVIGGRPHALAYLRASMIGRRDRHVEQRRQMPRLLRVVESWIGHFKADVRRAAMTESMEIREELDKLDAVIAAAKRERRRHSHRKGAPSRPSRPVDSRSFEVDEAHGHQGRESHEDSYDSRRSHHFQDSGHYSSQFDDDEQQWMDQDETCQASIYLDCQMQRQGVTEAKRREMFEMDMHPAVRDYAQNPQVSDRLQKDIEPKLKSDADSLFSNASAVPAPLNLARKHGELTPPDSNSGGDVAESVWEDVSVFSPPQSMVAGQSRDRHTAAPNTGSDAESALTTLADNRAHLEFCQKWGFDPGSEFREASPIRAQTRRDADTVSVAVASSVYSEHPGFRRSQQSLAPPTVPLRSPMRNSHRAPTGRSRLPAHDQRDKNLWDELRQDRERLQEHEDEE